MSSPSMALDDLRRLVAQADAMFHSAEEQLDNPVKPDRRSLERVAHLASTAAKATSAALAAVDQLAAKG